MYLHPNKPPSRRSREEIVLIKLGRSGHTGWQTNNSECNNRRLCTTSANSFFFFLFSVFFTLRRKNYNSDNLHTLSSYCMRWRVNVSPVRNSCLYLHTEIQQNNIIIYSWFETYILQYPANRCINHSSCDRTLETLFFKTGHFSE